MLGDLQLQTMDVIWERTNATVAEVHEDLSNVRNLAYTTVLSTLRGLERRGFLEHTMEGKAHRFHAKISRSEYTRDSVHHLLKRLFSGDPAALMSHLLGSESLDVEDLERIRTLLAEEENR